MIKRNFLIKVFLALVSMGLIGGAIFFFDLFKEKDLKIHLHTTSNNRLEDWQLFHPDNESFAVLLPSDPDSITRDIPIPRTNKTLRYQEYRCQNTPESRVSISYIMLPNSWAKLSSNFILKSALKVITYDKSNNRLIAKRSNLFKSFPSLDYEQQNEQTETIGSLILVNHILYKIEMTYPLDERDEVQEEIISQFIDSFDPLFQSNNQTITPPNTSQEIKGHQSPDQDPIVEIDQKEENGDEKTNPITEESAIKNHPDKDA